MNRHHTDRRPKRSRTFAWARVAHNDGVQYRLFRRDSNGALHLATLQATNSEPVVTAAALRVIKRRLRDKVDEIDLRRMGVGA